MLARRSLLLGLGSGLVTLGVPYVARAGLARAVTLKQLVDWSQRTVIGDPVDAFSQWVEVGGRKRIVTYTRVLVQDDLLGKGDSEVMVRTLGGRVGKIGQIVHGEAELRQGERAVLFLQPGDDATERVTALAQGHYPLIRDAGGASRLTISRHVAELVPTKDAAVERLKGRTLKETVELIEKAKAR